MKSSRSISNSERLQTLRNLLAHQRNEALARIRDFRRAQEEDAEPLPGDELDAARALAEVETHAGLIERAEYRLKAIAAALSRVEEGRYGICEGCGEDIPVDRLKVLPFAAYCVDCQSKRNHRAGRVKALSMSLRAIFGTCPRKWMNRWKSRMR